MTKLAASYAAARRITRRASSTFYLASLLFEPTIRRDIQVLYAFCRVADDIADDPHLIRAMKLQRLAQMRAALEDGASTPEPAEIWPAVREIIAHYELPLEQLREVLEGVSSDIDFRQPKTIAELDRYSYLVAGVVGLLSARILGVRRAETFQAAKSLGIAMQYTNIVRDVHHDLTLGRVYIHQSVMKQVGVTPSMLKSEHTTPEIEAAVRLLADRAEDFYQKSEPGIQALDKKYQQPVRAASGLYRSILERVKQKQYNVFTGRTRLNRIEKLSLVWSVYQTPAGTPVVKGHSQKE